MSLFVAFDNFIFNEFLCGFQMLIYKLRIQLSLKMFGLSSNQSIETVLSHVNSHYFSTLPFSFADVARQKF